MSQPTPLQQAHARALLQNAVIPVARVIQDAAHDIQKRYAIDDQRMEKALRLWLDDALTALPSGNFQVRSETDSNRFYQVNPLQETCNCRDCEGRQIICKHLACFLLARELNRLPAVRNPIAEREAKQRAERVRQPRTEFLDVLDMA